MTTITCREAIDRFLAAYVDDELAPEERARFEDHLSLCDPCVSYLDTYRQAIALAHAAAVDDSPATLPPLLLDAIMAALEEPARPDEG